MRNIRRFHIACVCLGFTGGAAWADPARSSADDSVPTAPHAENGSTIRRHPVGNDVQRVNLATGTRSRLWRSPVAHDPLGAAIGPDGRLYVTLFLSGRVVSFTV